MRFKKILEFDNVLENKKHTFKIQLNIDIKNKYILDLVKTTGKFSFEREFKFLLSESFIYDQIETFILEIVKYNNYEDINEIDKNLKVEMEYDTAEICFKYYDLIFKQNIEFL